MISLKKRAFLIAACCLFFMNCLSIEAKSRPYQATDVFTILKDYKRVKQLKGNSGELLGYIYVKENKHYKSGVLSTLLVVKQNGVKLDTLYKIDGKGFFNSKGKMELKNEPKGYYGFKLAKASKASTDLFSIEFVDSKGNSHSDDNNFLIDWKYKSKMFEYYPAP